QKLLQDIQKSGAKLSWLEKLFRDKLKAEDYQQQYKREVASLSERLREASQRIEELEQGNLSQSDNFILQPDTEFISYISQSFQLIEHDENKLQATGIDSRIFDDFEARLVEYLKEEFSKIPADKLVLKLEDALDDINSLKSGQDPDYRFSLTPHVYFMKYFLENVYCIYLAWFVIYQAGLLRTNINILDIAAGPGTVAYGLAVFLQSLGSFLPPMQPVHVSYFSLEKQDAFQFRGLQFWRRYIESRKTPINAFFRFVTDDLFTWDSQSSNIPKDFFDFVVISHCFFLDTTKRQQANNIYKQIISKNLKNQGYVLLIVQDKKLWKTYDCRQAEDLKQENNLVINLAAELGLKVVWYKYLNSTGSRIPLGGGNFAKFARENLPKQPHLTPLLQQYFGQKYVSHYSLDDYVILAQK
ncbi:MAG: photosystem II assembly protein, partial [Nostocaceae cyanobacterium]|nr:photosystem II assembly protein [Nostocaceae cyanobacterium]